MQNRVRVREEKNCSIPAKSNASSFHPYPAWHDVHLGSPEFKVYFVSVLIAS